MTILIAILQTFLSWVQTFLASLLGVTITDITPRGGWPGTIFTIRGFNFSANRDENDVRIGGERAIVIDATPALLTAMAGEATKTGAVTVAVAGKTATASAVFQVLPRPAFDNIAVAGPPRFFHGPQKGTPKTNTPNQPVLVLFAHAKDQSPDEPMKTAAVLRNELIAKCGEANRWWQQASFNRTSWTMTFSNWLTLPNPDNFYFWRDSDVDAARRQLLAETLRPFLWQSTTIVNGAIPVEHTSPLSYAYKFGVPSGGASVTASALSGTRLYVGTGSGSVFIHDIANLNATVALGNITIAGQFITALELVGTRLYAALRDTGFAVIDVTNPAAPALVTQVLAGAGCYAVRVSGNDLWLGRQNHLEQYSLLGGLPSFVNTTELNAWITSIDAAGALLAASTDGDGVHLFDTSGGGALPKSENRALLNVRSVTLAGSMALLAAYENGMLVLDLGNPAAPFKRGALKTTKAVCRIRVQGTEAMLALGGLDMLAVDVSNPDAPKRHHGEQPSTSDPDVPALRNQIKAAVLGLRLVKDKNALFTHALRLYFNSVPGGESTANLGQYVGVIVILKGPSLRGQSFPKETAAYYWPDNIPFFDTKGLIYLAHDASVGRVAHEIGHWLGMDDIYEDKLDTGEIVPGTAQAFCLSGSHDEEPLFAGRELNDTMRILDLHPNNTQMRTWSPTAQLDEVFTIVAHHGVENTDGSRIHMLRLVASEGLIYFVETRELQPPGMRFDQRLPVTAPGQVVVTRATTAKSFSNSLERAVMLVNVLGVNQQAVDAARNMTIRVEEQLPGSPLAYRVRVRWNQPIAGDPSGTFDMGITPWSTETWESVDIAIDSKLNGEGVFEFSEPGKPGVPILNGDRPWINHKNVIIAKVRNTAPGDVPEVYVSCYVTTPPGIGDNGNWALLETKLISNFKGNSEQELRFDWTPKAGGHTCIKIAILPMQGEINTDNNSAQENVAVFDSTAASSHQPVVLSAEVRSPFSVIRKVDLAVRGLPLGWHAVVEHDWVWLEGKGIHPVRAVIWTDRDSNAPLDVPIPPDAFPRIEGWTDFDHRYIPIGGILAPVRAVKRVEIHTQAVDRHGAYVIYGNLVPPVANVPLAIEVTHESGHMTLFYSATDSSGSYSKSIGVYGTVKLGTYSVQVHTAGGAGAGVTSGPIVSLTVTR
jgi:hypothetical protein